MDARSLSILAAPLKRKETMSKRPDPFRQFESDYPCVPDSPFVRSLRIDIASAYVGDGLFVPLVAESLREYADRLELGRMGQGANEQMTSDNGNVLTAVVTTNYDEDKPLNTVSKTEQNKVTDEQIESIMAGVTYHTYLVPGTTTTICVAILPSGYTITNGISSCVDPDNFNEQVGQEYAMQDATEKARDALWEMEGYVLMKALSQQPKPKPELLSKADSSIRAEQLVLGGLMLDNRAWGMLDAKLCADSFTKPAHQLIFQAMQYRAEHRMPFGVETLTDALSGTKTLEDAGGADYIEHLANTSPVTANINVYAGIVLARALKRSMADIEPKQADKSKPFEDRRHIMEAEPKPVVGSPINAEQSVLGALMLDSGAWDKLLGKLVDTDFSRVGHQLIFIAIQILASQNKRIDAITVSEKLDAAGKLDEVGGIGYLGAIAKNIPDADNIAAYADIVRDYSLKRQQAEKEKAHPTHINGLKYKPTAKRFPLYKSHKEVRAVQIQEISGTVIIPEGPYAAFTVSEQYLKKHDPKAGGYFVVYEGGYESFSPAGPFESGNTRVAE